MDINSIFNDIEDALEEGNLVEAIDLLTTIKPHLKLPSQEKEWEWWSGIVVNLDRQAEELREEYERIEKVADSKGSLWYWLNNIRQGYLPCVGFQFSYDYMRISRGTGWWIDWILYPENLDMSYLDEDTLDNKLLSLQKEYLEEDG